MHPGYPTAGFVCGMCFWCGFRQRGTLIFASSVPQCRVSLQGVLLVWVSAEGDLNLCLIGTPLQGFCAGCAFDVSLGGGGGGPRIFASSVPHCRVSVRDVLLANYTGKGNGTSRVCSQDHCSQSRLHFSHPSSALVLAGCQRPHQYKVLSYAVM